MSSVAQVAPVKQEVPPGIKAYRPGICLICLQPAPERTVMHHSRIMPLKRHDQVWSMRCRCPRRTCKKDFTVRLKLNEEQEATVVTHPDQVVLEYAQGKGTCEEVANQHGFDAASSVWRPVDAALNQVEKWIDTCTIFLPRHLPEAVAGLMHPGLPVDFKSRRLRKPDRPRLLALLRELPRYVDACARALCLGDWPFGALRFMRTVGARMDNTGLCS